MVTGDLVVQTQLEGRAQELMPWRYSHSNGETSILGDPSISQIEAKYDSRKELRAIFKSILNGRDPGELRVLDVGCLEGHYTAEIAQMGFKEVVGIDISPSHLQRASFLLGEFHGLANFRLEHCAATDVAQIASLGPFDIVLCYGLLYHLKDPLVMFDVFEAVAPQGRPFSLLLNTQFKGDFRALVSPLPTAELQVKIGYKEAKKVGDRFIYSSMDQSVFERLSLRLNPSAVYQTLLQYGYQNIVALDTPRGATYGYSMNLVCQKGSSRPAHEPGDWLNLGRLAEASVSAENWTGRSVDGFHFDKGPFWWAWRRTATLLHKLVYKLTVSRLIAARRR